MTTTRPIGAMVGRTEAGRDGEATAQVTKPDQVPGGAGARLKSVLVRLTESEWHSVRISFVNQNQFFFRRKGARSENGAGSINFRLPLLAERPTHSRNRNSRKHSSVDQKLIDRQIRDHFSKRLFYIIYLSLIKML